MRIFLVAFFGMMTLLSATEVVDVSPKQVAEMIAGKNTPTILDVRTKDEHDEMKIAGSIVIDVTTKDFESKAAKLDPKKPYILHCRSGSRSKRALKVLEKLGFEKIYHMHEGMLGWQDAGMKTE